jgi:hypothetical protein
VIDKSINPEKQLINEILITCRQINNGYGLIVGEQMGKKLVSMGFKDGDGFIIQKLLNE